MQEVKWESLGAFRLELGRLLALHCSPPTASALLARADAAILGTEQVCRALCVYVATIDITYTN